MLRRSDPERVRVRGGFSLLDLKRFAESRGYRAAGYAKLELDQLLAMGAAIVPVEEFGDPHFVVVRGMKDGALSIADPAFGNRALAPEQFLKIWKQGLALVITRRAH
jgi:predicted double-glycine peptidase